MWTRPLPRPLMCTLSLDDVGLVMVAITPTRVALLHGVHSISSLFLIRQHILEQ